MKNLNKIILIGRITNDCTFGFLNSGSAKADFSIAVNDRKKEGDEWVDETSFFNITVWGKTAENLKQYLKRGQQVAIEGRLKQDRWEKDGKKFSAVKIICESVELLGGQRNRNETSNTAVVENDNESNGESNVEYENGFPEDIPF